MSVEHRVNKKTGKDQYCVRYRWKDETGKLKGSQTGWFDTINQAQREADKLKEAKEADSALSIRNKREAYIKTVFRDLWHQELVEIYKKKPIGERTTTLGSLIREIETVYKYYMSETILYTRINEITPRTFRMWLNELNESDLSGATTEKYSTVLFKFNRWLADKGYYTDSSLELDIENAMSRVSLKSRKIGARKDRYLMGMDDIEKLTNVFKRKGLGSFYNFYHYTLYYTLAYTGMRPGEARALQWKSVDLREDERIIYIVNCIPDGESESKAIERTKKNIYFVKTDDSERGIPIFDIIYQLLVDYKESYMYQFGLTHQEMDDCFVFPHLNHNHTFDPHMFAGRGVWAHKLKEHLKLAEIPNTDIQMFRHTCATFLVAPEPDGLGFTEESVMSFFGHTSTAMVRQVYARLEQQQKTARLKRTFTGYYSPKENKKDTERDKARRRMIERVSGDNAVEMNEARAERIYLQVFQALLQQRPYYYKEEDEEIIRQIKQKFDGKYDIKFIKED